jgi:hypothetical protein
MFQCILYILWLLIFYSECVKFRPSLWSNGQSSWLQIQRSWFDSWRYQIFWDIVGLERGPLGLVSTTEELLERKSSGPILENQEYSCRDLSHWPCGTLYPQRLALTSPTSGYRLVSIVCSQTRVTEFWSFFYVWRSANCIKEIVHKWLFGCLFVGYNIKRQPQLVTW